MNTPTLHHLARFGRHILNHIHEIIVGLAVEAPNMHLPALMIALAVLLVVFAVQLIFAGEGV